MSTTPAFSPTPTRRCSRISSVVLSPNWRRCTLLDLYEQCSLHITEYMASSDEVGRRPKISRSWAYSSGLRPSSDHGCWASGVAAASATVSNEAREGCVGEVAGAVMMAPRYLLARTHRPSG